jgi:hypothetical protein
MQSLNGGLIAETLLRQFLPRLALSQPVSDREVTLIVAVDAVLEGYAKSCRPAER